MLVSVKDLVPEEYFILTDKYGGSSEEQPEIRYTLGQTRKAPNHVSNDDGKVNTWTPVYIIGSAQFKADGARTWESKNINPRKSHMHEKTLVKKLTMRDIKSFTTYELRRDIKELW